MMENNNSPLLKHTLIQVLSDTGLSQLPKEYEGTKVWVKAIGLVTKRDCSKSYAILQKNSFDSYGVKKIYGSVSAINKVEAIYPYEFADMSFVPKFAPRDRVNRLEYVKRYFNDESGKYDECTTEQLIEIIRRIAVELYIKNTNNRQ